MKGRGSPQGWSQGPPLKIDRWTLTAVLAILVLSSMAGARPASPGPGPRSMLPGVPEVTVGNQSCVGSSSATSLKGSLQPVPAGSTIYVTVWVGTGTATVNYAGDTYHGSAIPITSTTGASWQGWFYAQNLSASSSVRLYANATGITQIGMAATLLVPSVAGDAILYDTSGGLASTTKTQITAYVTTTHSNDWVGMGFSDDDGSADVSVGASETVLSDCNIPTQAIYLGLIEQTQPVVSPSGVTLTAAISNYGSADASGFYELHIQPLSMLSLTATPANVSIGQPSLFSASTQGGTPPYHYAYAGLPPGCASSDTANLTCQPTGAGTFPVRGWANDSAGGSANLTTLLTVLPGGPTCVGTGAGSTVTTSPTAVPAGSAIFATVWAGTGPATVSYVGGTYHGSATPITSATGADWQGWYYVQNLPASSSLVLYANTTGTTQIGIGAAVLAPSTPGDQVLYDTNGSVGSTTLT